MLLFNLFYVKYLAGKNLILDTEFCDLSKELEKHADLNVSSKADMASALKKLVAMVMADRSKDLKDEGKAEFKRSVINNIENGILDVFDQYHPSLQERLAYLKAACDSSASSQIQEPEDCGPSVTV
jgi:hypothetical protein